MINFRTVLLLVTLLLLAISSFRLQRLSKSNNKRIHKLENNLVNKQEENDKLKNVIGYMYQYEGKKMPDLTVYDEKGIRRKFQEFCTDAKEWIVFYFSSNDCSHCVEEAMKQLSENKDSLPLVVISDFSSISSMKYLKNKYDLEGVLFFKATDNDFLDITTPSVFSTDKTLIIRRFLIINQEDTVLKPYLKQLNNDTK